MMMKRYLLIFCACMFSMFIKTSAQMMKPSVVVFPSDAWCKINGYADELADGTIMPNYKKALSDNIELLNVISKINNIMAERGFPLGNLESAIKDLSVSDIERTLYKDKNGNGISVSPLDELYRSISPDIILQLTWKVNKSGPKYSVTFNLQALDSYTLKQIAGAEGTGSGSFSSDVSVLLEEAVVKHMDNFCELLMQHFRNIKEKGREISVDFLLSDGVDLDFSTEFGDYELMEVVTGLIASNAVNHSFGRGPSTDTMLQFRSVCAPATDDNGIPVDAYSFGRKIARVLKKPPYNLSSKVIAKGLGKVIIVIGEN